MYGLEVEISNNRCRDYIRSASSGEMKKMRREKEKVVLLWKREKERENSIERKKSE